MPLFALGDAELHARLARRVVADAQPEFPCGVSRVDAARGGTLVLPNQHHDVETPFRTSHAIYVREDAAQCHPAAGEVPALLHTRMLSLRGFGANGIMVTAALADGIALEPGIEAMLTDPAETATHLHVAKPGRYAARVKRA